MIHEPNQAPHVEARERSHHMLHHLAGFPALDWIPNQAQASYVLRHLVQMSLIHSAQPNHSNTDAKEVAPHEARRPIRSTLTHVTENPRGLSPHIPAVADRRIACISASMYVFLLDTVGKVSCLNIIIPTRPLVVGRGFASSKSYLDGCFVVNNLVPDHKNLRDSQSPFVETPHLNPGEVVLLVKWCQERLSHESSSCVQEELHLGNFLVNLLHKLNDKVDKLVLEHFLGVEVGY